MNNQLTQIEQDNVSNIQINETKAKGIPLTKELLISHGFKEAFNGEYFYHPRLKFMDHYYLPYKIFSNCSCYSYEKDGQQYAHYVKVEYLHEMKNLYVALTGEPLKSFAQ